MLAPLLAFSGNDEIHGALHRTLRARYAHSTHFEIFPTLLIALGYRPDEVHRSFGPSLFSEQRSQWRFYTGDVFGRDRRGRWLEFSPGTSK